MFSARFMPADEAQQMGLINFIAERDAIETQCIEYAQRIANAPMTVPAKFAVNTGARHVPKVKRRAPWSTPADSDDYKEDAAPSRQRKTNSKIDNSGICYDRSCHRLHFDYR